MKLLLHTDVPQLGHLGDVVEVKDGYARNFLIPQGLAVEPTEANIKSIADERAKQAEIRQLARTEMVKACEKVDGAVVRIEELANERGHLFGSITEDKVAETLRVAGYEVASKQVTMSEHFRTVGNYDIAIRFADDILANVRVEVVAPGGEVEESESTEESETTDQAEITDGEGTTE